MAIQSKVDWLRGFLESLEYSDTISKGQIQLLKEKLNLLLEEIEENEFSEYDEEGHNNNQSNDIWSSTSSSNDFSEDLPF
jgi:phosphosulfolactate synthase (CoM biosynthesis protein A)